MAEESLGYLNDPTIREFNAVVTHVTEAGGELRVELSVSYFYPQGGGQPSDIGEMVGPTGRMLVRKVTLEGDRVIHSGTLAEGTLQASDSVACHITERVRTLHSKLHSGGHVIMTAVHSLKHLNPTKGYHFPDGPYVEFEGTLPVEDREAFPAALQTEIDRLVAEGGDVGTEFCDLDTLKSRGVFIPMELPANKPTRVVTTAGYESPCGGTHVSNLSELEGLHVRAVKAKSGRTKVSYSLADQN